MSYMRRCSQSLKRNANTNYWRNDVREDSNHTQHQSRRAAADPDPGSAGAGVGVDAVSELDWYEVLCLARWLAWGEPGYDPNSVEVFMEAQRLLER